jgi:hypothetical protein
VEDDPPPELAAMPDHRLGEAVLTRLGRREGAVLPRRGLGDALVG